jgi:hypothetical protein
MKRRDPSNLSTACIVIGKGNAFCFESDLNWTNRCTSDSELTKLTEKQTGAGTADEYDESDQC